jgi:hypothetical protein
MKHVAQTPMLFDAKSLPEMAIPVAEASVEWREAQMLRLVEGIRFSPERLASYLSRGGDAGFLDFVIERLGGRSQ